MVAEPCDMQVVDIKLDKAYLILRVLRRLVVQRCVFERRREVGYYHEE
jgi:hypothetical protein